MVDWDSPKWGQSGHNVHHAGNGSWWGEDEERTDS
jgi:hypothetical protein